MANTKNIGLAFVDDLVADGKAHFTFAEGRERLQRSPGATANILRRLVENGLVDRVRRGHYVVRSLGVLGTRAVAESLSLAVAAAFVGLPHRIAYRSALDEHDLISHPSRTVQVACTRRVRSTKLSGRPLRTILETELAIDVGSQPHGDSEVSDINRALLDAAARPELVGGAAVLAEALAAAGSKADPQRLTYYAAQLNWAPALCRIGSLADALELTALAGKLSPLSTRAFDIALEPGTGAAVAWRDPRWRVRWAQPRDELVNVVWQ